MSSTAREYAAFFEAERKSDRLLPPPDKLASGQVTDSVFVKADEERALLQVAARRAAGPYRPTKRTAVVGRRELTVGSFSIGWKNALPASDLEFIRRRYTRAAVGTTEIEVGGDRIDADLAAAGEVDRYHFVVPEPATHIIKTEGPGDTATTGVYSVGLKKRR